MRKLINPANIRKLFLVLLCCLLCQGEFLYGRPEREFYRQDFYLKLNRPEELQNDRKEPDLDSYEKEDGNEDSSQKDFYEEENQITMSDDYFVVPPEGRKREDILFLYLLPGFMGFLTLTLIWVYFKAWLDSKKEMHQTRQRLLQVRQKFRGRETDPEFAAQLKAALQLPPGATSRDISRAMPVQDNELQQMINKYDDNFRKPGT